MPRFHHSSPCSGPAVVEGGMNQALTVKLRSKECRRPRNASFSFFLAERFVCDASAAITHGFRKCLPVQGVHCLLEMRAFPRSGSGPSLIAKSEGEAQHAGSDHSANGRSQQYPSRSLRIALFASEGWLAILYVGARSNIALSLNGLACNATTSCRIRANARRHQTA